MTIGLVHIMQDETDRAGFVQAEEQSEGESKCCLQVHNSFRKDRLPRKGQQK